MVSYATRIPIVAAAALLSLGTPALGAPGFGGQMSQARAGGAAEFAKRQQFEGGRRGNESFHEGPGSFRPGHTENLRVNIPGRGRHLDARQSAKSERRVGPIAKERARQLSELKSHGILHLAKKTLVSGGIGGALGVGAGLLLGGPAVAALGVAGAGAGVAVHQLFRGGMVKYSTRSFARSQLAEMEGRGFAKHAHKIKAIFQRSVESAVNFSLLNAGLGAALGGPAGIVPGAIMGAALGAAWGGVEGVVKGYVAPVFKKWSLNRSLHKVEKAIGKLEKNRDSHKAQERLAKELGKLQGKADRMPLMSKRQTRRYNTILDRLGQTMSASPADHQGMAFAE